MEGFTKYLNIADSLDIMIYVSNQESYTLPAFVYEVVDDTRIIISNPIHEGHLYAMEKQYQYYFRFYIENNGMYLFKGIVIRRMQYDNLPSVLIELVSEIKKIQRRKFFRVTFKSKGAVIIERNKSDEELKVELARAQRKFQTTRDVIVDETVEEKVPFESLDLSGGGIRIRIKKSFELGDFITGEVLLESVAIRFTGEVTRVEKKDNSVYEVGIKFVGLDESTQSKIVGYVFDIERNLIKKGLM